jgi:hypothetical protein
MLVVFVFECRTREDVRRREEVVEEEEEERRRRTKRRGILMTED